jgi:hypothetical protein
VNNLARPEFEFLGGVGSLSASGSIFMLDFGTIELGQTVSASLSMVNAASGPADSLFGSFDSAFVDMFTLFGFSSPLEGIDAGGGSGPLNVSFTAGSVGTVSQTLTFTGFGRNPFGPDMDLGTVSLLLNARAVDLGGGPGDPSVIPLPGAGWLLLGALGGMAVLRRRRSA